MSDERKTGGNCSWHDFASSILTSGISTLCLYGAIQVCPKHMAGFLASSESSPSPERMEFCDNFLSKWNFAGILFGRLLARIAEYSLNGSPREVKFHNDGNNYEKKVECKGAIHDKLDKTKNIVVVDGYVTFTRSLHYLGSMISFNLRSDGDVTAQVAAATASMEALKEVWWNPHLNTYSKYLLF
jgi:hypothetical protein